MPFALYALFISALGLERLYELRLSRRHAAWSFARGGREYGQAHYPAMVMLHTGLLAGSLTEAWWRGTAAPPALAAAGVAVAATCQLLRYWVIHTLGPQWNTRVIVVPGLPRITNGPYRCLKHPNYAAVVIEGLAIPLAGGAWLTAALFAALNAALLGVRIRCEERALAELRGEQAARA